MSEKWNLTEAQWSEVMLDGVTPESVAGDLKNGRHLPWTEILLQCSAESEETLDLGSGSGHHSAMLALHGRQTTLLDWSKNNIEFAPDDYFSDESRKMMTDMGFFQKANLGPVWMQVNEPKADDFVRLAALPYKHVLCGHGAPLRDNAKEAYGERFRQVFGI